MSRLLDDKHNLMTQLSGRCPLGTTESAKIAHTYIIAKSCTITPIRFPETLIPALAKPSFHSPCPYGLMVCEKKNRLISPSICWYIAVFAHFCVVSAKSAPSLKDCCERGAAVSSCTPDVPDKSFLTLT